MAKNKVSNKKILLGIACAVLVLAGVGGVILWRVSSPSNPYEHLRGQSGTDESGLEIIDQERYGANKLIGEGRLDAAKAVYDSRIRAAEGDENVAKEHAFAANAFLSFGEGEVEGRDRMLEYALFYAQESERLHSTVGSAGTLERIYRAKGNAERAEHYNQLLNERMRESDESSAKSDQ